MADLGIWRLTCYFTARRSASFRASVPRLKFRRLFLLVYYMACADLGEVAGE
jgi:hypothetical protein